MGTTPVMPRPWPTEPRQSADAATRMAWYAAVARWAPSKHNTQPWRFVVGQDTLEIWADPMRLLTATDPHRREVTISCGAAVETACVAARAHGYELDVTTQPGGPGGPLAHLAEVGPWDSTEIDRALLAAVPRRRTDRGPLDADLAPTDLRFNLQSAAQECGAWLRLVSTPGDRATLASLVERADRLLVRRTGVDAELAPWMREPGDPRADGVPTDHTRGAAASYRAEFVQRDFSSSTSLPAQDRPGRDAPIVGVLCTSGDRPPDWLQAGRALAAILLRAAAVGVHASYLNQPVEHAAIRAELREHLGLPGVAQLVLRLGVGGEVSAPPRRDPDDVTFEL